MKETKGLNWKSTKIQCGKLCSANPWMVVVFVLSSFSGSSLMGFHALLNSVKTFSWIPTILETTSLDLFSTRTGI